MEGVSESEMVEHCEDQCHGHNSCNRLKPEDFLNHDACQRNGFHFFINYSYFWIFKSIWTVDQNVRETLFKNHAWRFKGIVRIPSY